MKNTTKCILWGAVGSFVAIPIAGFIVNWSTAILPGIFIGIGMLVSAYISATTDD